MKSLTPATCRFIIATALAYAALPVASQAQGASASARLENNLSGSGHVGGIATPVNSGPAYQEARIEDLAPDGTMTAFAYGGAGVVGAHTEIRFNGANSNSGGLGAVAIGHWYEVMDLVVPDRFALSDVAFFTLDYNVETHGGVAAAGHFGADHHARTMATAYIDYFLSLGSSRYFGSQSDDSLNGGSVTGIWGTIAGTATAGIGGSLYLQMVGSASSSVGNFFAFGERTAASEADFGSTLIWGGITHVTAFNVSGQLITLPEDFQLDLIGRESGFNYWNAAPHPNAAASVPESAPALLLLAPTLLGLALLHRRRQSVAFSA